MRIVPVFTTLSLTASILLSPLGARADPPADPPPVGGLSHAVQVRQSDDLAGTALASDPTSVALGFVRSDSRAGVLQAPRLDYTVASTDQLDDLRIVRLTPRLAGYRVHGGQVTVRLLATSAGLTVDGFVGPELGHLQVPAPPRLDEQQSLRHALGSLAETERPHARLSVVGMAILPIGKGVLVRQVRAQGSTTAGTSFAYDIYVDTHHGQVQSVTPLRTSFVHGQRPSAASAPVGTLATEGPGTSGGAVQTTGQRINGASVPIHLVQNAANSYAAQDLSLKAQTGSEINTYDGHGVDVGGFVLGLRPEAVKLAAIDAVPLDAAHTASGLVDAHWAASQVLHFYNERFGRKGLDGEGAEMASVINVTEGGKRFNNAFWDGSQMVYGTTPWGRSFAAATDVVGHETTHGVITATANLINEGQSGAVNEGLADYFGNAFQNHVEGKPSTDPTYHIMGEDLCDPAKPATQCPSRDLGKLLTTSKDFVGTRYDNGGTHINSGLIANTLWRLRSRLGADLADRLVYRTLVAHLASTSDLLATRKGIESAARAMKLTADQQAMVSTVFDEAEIKDGWQRALRVDAAVRDAKVATETQVYGYSVAEGIMVSTRRGEIGGEYAPRHVVISPTDKDGWTTFEPSLGGDSHSPSTDGRSIVWVRDVTEAGSEEGGTQSAEIRRAPVAGGESELIAKGAYFARPVAHGDAVAWLTSESYINDHDLLTGWVDIGLSYRAHRDAPIVTISRKPGEAIMHPSIHGKHLAFVRAEKAIGRPADEVTPILVVLDMSTGEKVERELTTLDGKPMPFGGLRMTKHGVAWAAGARFKVGGDAHPHAVAVTHADAAVSGGLFTSGPDLASPRLIAANTAERKIVQVTANDEVVTYTSMGNVEDVWTNEAQPRLYQLPFGGGSPTRVSCSTGWQSSPQADRGTGVLWFDGSDGTTKLMHRATAAGDCALAPQPTSSPPQTSQPTVAPTGSPTPTAAPSEPVTTTTGAPTPESTVAVGPHRGGPLASTGLPVAALLLGSLALVGAGGALMVSTRRRLS